jgi:hypothetical protein
MASVGIDVIETDLRQRIQQLATQAEEREPPTDPCERRYI